MGGWIRPERRRATGSDAAHGSAASAVHTHPTEAIGQGRDAGPRAVRPAHRGASTCHGTAWGQRGPNLAEWACCAYARARARACSLLLDLDVRACTRERAAVPAHDHAEPRGGDAPIALQLIEVRRAFGVRGGVRVWGPATHRPKRDPRGPRPVGQASRRGQPRRAAASPTLKGSATQLRWCQAPSRGLRGLKNISGQHPPLQHLSSRNMIPY